MLFDIGWPELMLIGLVALVVIGPKDLPRALRTAGFWVRKARTLSRDFQNSIDQMIREAELDEVHQEIKKATEFDVATEFHNTVDPTGSLAESIKPPDLPDYFEPAPGSGEPAGTPPQAALPAPAETALPDLTAPVEGTPEQAVLPLGLPERPVTSLEPPGAPAEAPKMEAEPAPAPQARPPQP